MFFFILVTCILDIVLILYCIVSSDLLYCFVNSFRVCHLLCLKMQTFLLLVFTMIHVVGCRDVTSLLCC